MPLEVVIAVKWAQYHYAQIIKKEMPKNLIPMTMATMKMNTSRLYKVLLKEHPKALDGLRDEGHL